MGILHFLSSYVGYFMKFRKSEPPNAHICDHKMFIIPALNNTEF